tara:strand:+ start:857 stop:1417 length:561 start_codon:yes stop_codon:yes gene_type:complete
MDKSENRLKYKIEDKIGILGGTFDPPHKGHLKISQLAKKKFNLKKVIWAITKKNPFKTKSYFYLNKRIKLSRNLTKNQKYIKIDFFEKKINSNKTINLIKHFKDKNKKREIYFLLGADNLINFHKWNNWRKIPKFCKIVVFDRKSFKTKAKRSLAYKLLKNKGLIYINFKKINISSSKIRNFWYDQ